MVNPILKFLDNHHTLLIEGLEGVASFVAPEAAPGIILAGEAFNQRWNQADQLVAEANATIDQAKSTYAQGSKELQDIYDKVGLINSTIEQHKSTMSNKQPKTPNFNSPSANPRQNKVPTITSRATSKTKAAQRGANIEFSMRDPGTSVTSSALTGNISYFDSHLIEGPSEKSLTALTVKIGKQLYPDVITPFLKNLCGSGKIRMQFAGRCMSYPNKRHTHMQMFRHRLSAGTEFTPEAWPDGTPGTPNFILGPQNTVPFKIDGGGGSTVGDNFAVGTTSFRDIINGTSYWAPYNKADLEDLSWNLNALKLDNPLWHPPTPVPAGALGGVGFEQNVPLFQSEAHARQSQIAKNNKEAVDLPPSATSRTAAYRYNAVFNKGTVHYDFMNKGTGGAKVELIVYRIKKGVNYSATGSNFAGDSSILNSHIASSIGNGYLETCVEKGGTDELLGRPPNQFDVSENPAFPFLPVLKKTVGSDMPFVEISRQTFAMPSGSRRSVNIMLPGEVYDPANIVSIGSPGLSLGVPIIDHGTYCIMMSVSGVKCTNEVTNTQINVPGVPKGDYNIGDMFSPANIQFYGTYTEHMGACQYKAEKTANIYTQGGLLMPTAATAALGGLAYTPVTMLPADSAVRVGVVPGANSMQQGSAQGQSNLNPSFDAEPL